MFNKLRGRYYSSRSKIKRKIAYIEKKIEATRNAVRPIWFSAPQVSQRPKIDPEKRIERFFGFCRDVEEHPYFLAHKKAGTITQKSSFDMLNPDSSELSIDEVHLESFLTRLRQVLFDNELYFFDELTDSVRQIFSSDSTFEDYCKDFKALLERPFPKTNVQVFLPNGEEAVAGRNIYELVEMELYTGRIHSEHTANPSSPYFPLANANVSVRKSVTFALSYSALKVAENIFCLRMHILRLARRDNRTEIFPALKEFDERAKQLGH